MDWKTNPDKIFCVDNGAYSIKFSTANEDSLVQTLQNCKFTDKNPYSSFEPFFVQNVNSHKETISLNFKSFSRPLSRGLLSDIDLEIEIWKKMFSLLNNNNKNSSSNKNISSLNLNTQDFNDSMFMFSYTPLCPDTVLEGYFQILFEYFDFDSIYKAMPHYYSAINAVNSIPELNKSVQLIIDSGYSSTTIVPILNNKPLYNSIRRIDVGGKLLTNYLKDALGNLSDLDLRKDFYLINLIKEELCYVSKNFTSDMKISSLKGNNNINYREFILPEFRSKSLEQLQKLPKDRYSISMNSLRFIVPEIIFNPSLIGIEEGGLQEGIAQSINNCHADYKNLLYENIVLTGGNCCLPNFNERLNHELIPNSDYDSDINVYMLNKGNNTRNKTKISNFDNDSKNKGIKEGNSMNIEDNSNSSSNGKINNDIIRSPFSEFNNGTSEKDFINYSVIDGMKSLSKNIDLLKEFSISRSDYQEVGSNILWKST